MDFIVETGEGLPDSTSYTSVFEAGMVIEFFYPNKLPEWNALSEEEKERRLIIATRFIDNLVSWNSYLKDTEQALEWPRKEFIDARGRTVADDIVPKVVREAVAGLAVESLSGALSTEVIKLTQEDFGDSSERYAVPKVIADNPFVHNLQKELVFYGIARNKSTIIVLERA